MNMLPHIKRLLGWPVSPPPRHNAADVIPELTEASDKNSDWAIYRYDRFCLTLAGSYSLAYGHELELRFASPSYINCPTDFEYPTFRSASPDELKHLQSFLDLDGQRVVVIDAESSNSMDTQPFVICAESFSVHDVNVAYFQSEDQNAK